jgi:ABC-type transport system involved in multi-copper enzyme maturation permease subunit
MTRALIWKEWRTQRSLVFAGLAIASVLPLFLMAGMAVTSPNHSFADLVSILSPLFMMFVWPVFAAAIAGSAFSADMSDDSLRFLLSRPVSRARVWLIKVGAALAAFLAVVLGTVVIGLVYARLTADGPRQLRFLVAQQLGGDGALDPEVLIVLVPFAFLFGCSVYCSTFAKRPLAAAVGGFLVAGAIVLIVGLVWMLLVPMSPISRDNFIATAVGIAVPVATIGIWAAAFWAFWRGDIFGGGARRRALWPLVTVTMVVLLAGTWPAVAAGARSLVSIAARHRGDLVLSDGAVIIAEETPSGYSTRLTRVPVGGGAATILAPEDATLPVVSPGGEWIVYVAHGGYLGMAAGEHELRAMRRDGSEDHAISPKLEWPWSYRLVTLIAPDNDHVAHISYPAVLVSTISGEGRTTVFPTGPWDGAADRVRRAEVIGWTATKPMELLYYRTLDLPPRQRRPDSPAPEAGAPGAARATRVTELLGLDPDTGESRLVSQFAGSHNLRVSGSAPGSYPTRGWTWLPAWIDDGEADRLYLIDTRSGEQIEVTESPCTLWGFSADGRRFVYGRCSGQMRYGDARSELRILDLASGADETFTGLEGYDESSGGREVLLSPDGERLLMYTRRGYDAERGTHVLSRGGDGRLLADFATPVTWISHREALLRQDEVALASGAGRAIRVLSRFTLNVVDVETGRQREIYPERQP